MWGMAMIALIVAFFALLIIKIVPTYLLDMKVRSALEGVAKQSQQSNMTNAAIRLSLDKRFSIDQVSRQDLNVQRDVKFLKMGRNRVIKIEYEVVTPMFGNISVLVQFDHQAEAGRFE
jgi:hypothetical protein